MKLLPWLNGSLSRQLAVRHFLCAGLALTCAFVLSSCDSHTDSTTQAPSSDADQGTAGGTAVRLPQDQLAATYATLTGVVAQADNENIWRQFHVQKEATVSITDNQMVVNATGDDASLVLPAFAAGKRFMIEAVIDSPNETSAQLFYLKKGQSKYTEAQSQIVLLEAGKNVVYFRLDDPDLIDPLRFDPCSTPGTYTIERMTAMGLPPAGAQ